jgi:hypothetical protein
MPIFFAFSWHRNLCFSFNPLGFGRNGGCDEPGSGVVSWATKKGRSLRFARERRNEKGEIEVEKLEEDKVKMV